MQRLFSMFPPGWPGLGLVLLRISVAAPMILDACATPEEMPGWALGALVLLSATLSVGFLTPMAALLALTVRVVGPAGWGDEVATCMAILSALALALLGPGAYSIDAYRFGRRVVVLPPRNPDAP
jgi:hypothetical protein